MSAAVEIFVELLDEGVQLLRPVVARSVRDDIYDIVEQPYDRSIERWAFE